MRQTSCKQSSSIDSVLLGGDHSSSFEPMSDPAALRKPKPQYKGRNGFEEEFPPADGTEFNGAALHAEAQKRRMMEWTLEHKGSSIPS